VIKQLQPDLASRRFLSIDEFVDVTGISKPTVYVWMREGKIPFTDLGGRRRIPVSFVDKLERTALAKCKARAAS
jgi:excisionase family DNA binding protein